MLPFGHSASFAHQNPLEVIPELLALKMRELRKLHWVKADAEDGSAVSLRDVILDIPMLTGVSGFPQEP